MKLTPQNLREAYQCSLMRARLNLEVQHFRIQDDVAWPNPIGN